MPQDEDVDVFYGMLTAADIIHFSLSQASLSTVNRYPTIDTTTVSSLDTSIQYKSPITNLDRITTNNASR